MEILHCGTAAPSESSQSQELTQFNGIPLLDQGSDGSGLSQEHHDRLYQITSKIHTSLNLAEILQATVTEMRAFLEYDRVKIYQFQPDDHGIVVAESVDLNCLPSLLHSHFPAEDIPPYAREWYLRERCRTIVNLQEQKIGLSKLPEEDTETAIEYRPVDPCHWEYLMSMGVQSSVVFPIVLENTQTPFDPLLPCISLERQLWGLLIFHHASPRNIKPTNVDFIQEVVNQLTIAICHAKLLEQAQIQVQQAEQLNKVRNLIQTYPNIRLQEALVEIVRVFQGCGGRLYLCEEPTLELNSVYRWCSTQSPRRRSSPRRKSIVAKVYS
jgi:light-regulated signal transduction histidine kinase (bacteriophytochrome)